MSVLGKAYTVKEGDTLWDIAAEQLGSGREWPRLVLFNNQKHINAIGVRKITNPDHIIAGETIRLPILPGVTPAATLTREKTKSSDKVQSRPASLSELLPGTNVPFGMLYPIEYEIGPIITPTAKLYIKISGSIALQSAKNVPITLATNEAVAIQAKTRTDLAIGTLHSETKYDFNTDGASFVFSNQLISNSSNIQGPKVGTLVKLSPNGIFPRFGGVITYPLLEGSVNGDKFYAVDYSIEFTIELHPPAPNSRPSPVRVFEPVYASSIPRALIRDLKSIDSKTLATTAMILTGVAIGSYLIVTAPVSLTATAAVALIALLLPTTQAAASTKGAGPIGLR